MGCYLPLKRREPFDLEKRLLLLGLDNAGKTSVLYRLCENKYDEKTSTPTVGLNVETAIINRIKLTLWDVGGKARSMWKHYFEETAAVVFVIDSTDS